MNRPESRNALTGEMIDQLDQAVQSCKRPDVRAVLITGSGGAFCAGANVKELVGTLEQDGPEALAAAIGKLAGDLHSRVVLPLRQLN